jgi:N-acetylated-alpha-linked acidic dipeptidase
MEEARALGELLRQGWRPKRTIIICAWDGEEPALLGSTEWVETHADELKEKAVAYLNTDSTGKGELGIGGSHSMERFVNDVARDIKGPRENKTLWEGWKERHIKQARTDDDKKEARERPDLRIGALGSGSDYTPFVQHMGIASLNDGFGGEGGGGVYHSIYDSFTWYTRFSDTDFQYGRALAQVNGTIMMRLADAELLPFDFTDLADTANKYLGELEGLAKKINPPKAIDFSPLKSAVKTLTDSAGRYDDAYRRASASGGAALDHLKQEKALNEMLFRSERRLTNEGGLPRRPWFKHLLYAPGFYTGYGVKTVPGVREAIEEKQWSDVDPQIKNVSAALTALASQIDQATQLLEGQ